ncbi:MAG TPA: hydroxymethylglutaryl-CoA lyase [Actinomycetota bacterium]|nr:hydroxymethylglutaryl-CoA lyase [Actinomycetota bacterium]
MDGPLTWPRSVRVREVGPRDGLQAERHPVATDDKVRLIEALALAGLRRIEAASFVSPKAVPQMADAAEVWARLRRRPGVVYSALVPNRRGAEAAVEAGADALQVFVAATDSYNMANVRRTVSESLRDVEEVADVARGAGIAVEGTISTAFGCPYEGDVAPGVAIPVVSPYEIAPTPRRVVEVVEAVRGALPRLDINMHFHDTRGTALANAVTALGLGVDYLDSSVGGLGGSPFATGATGNVATEDLVHMLDDMGIETGVDLGALLDAARLAQELVASPLPSRVLRAGPRLAPARPAEAPRAGG